MTQKDYEKFAAIFAAERAAALESASVYKNGGVVNDACANAAVTAVDLIIARTMKIFADDNPRFNPYKFRKACGY